MDRATIQLDVNVMEEQAESITGETTVVRARQTMRHWSVTSLTSEFQKVPYLSKKRRNFLGLKKKKNEQKVQYHSGVTAGKLQMQCRRNKLILDRSAVNSGTPPGREAEAESTWEQWPSIPRREDTK
ncbi:unnamed protein product [Caretta caretta]